MFLHLTCRAYMHIVLNFTSEKNNYISVKHYKYYHNYTKKKQITAKTINILYSLNITLGASMLCFAGDL